MSPPIKGLPKGLLYAALLTGMPAGPAQAFDQLTVEAGKVSDSNDSLALYRLGARRSWDRRWFERGGWALSGYWEVIAGQWRGDPGRTGNDSVTELGLRPVLRWARTSRSASVWRPYVEVGTGVHGFSDTDIENHALSTALQFGSHIGAGLVFGPESRAEIGWRFIHYSNAGIKKPNVSINFHTLVLGWRY